LHHLSKRKGRKLFVEWTGRKFVLSLNTIQNKIIFYLTRSIIIICILTLYQRYIYKYKVVEFLNVNKVKTYNLYGIYFYFIHSTVWWIFFQNVFLYNYPLFSFCSSLSLSTWL
jgi:hypothetical protein